MLLEALGNTFRSAARHVVVAQAAEDAVLCPELRHGVDEGSDLAFVCGDEIARQRDDVRLKLVCNADVLVHLRFGHKHA